MPIDHDTITHDAATQVSDVEHAEIDYTYMVDLNARELAQRITGQLNGMTVAGPQARTVFKIRVDDKRKAAVLAALVDTGAIVRQVEWTTSGALLQVVFG